MGNHVEILSKSSSGDPYTVMFHLEEKRISASCSCPAGKYRKLCKHILQMMDGNDSMLHDDNQKPKMDIVCLHLQNTPIPPLLNGLCEKESILKELQRDVKKAKKKIEKQLLQ